MNKKLIALVLVLAMALTFVLSSCNNTEKELTEQANTDHKEYVKTVTTNAVDAAAESIKPLNTLNDIKENCVITVDMGDFKDIQVKSIIAQILDKKAYLKILAGDSEEGKEAAAYIDNGSVIIDTEKAGTDKPGVYKIKTQDLISVMSKSLSAFGMPVGSDVEVNESMPEKILDILKNDITPTVTSEKVEVYGKNVKCIVSEIVINNELITKVIRDIFPVIKDSLGENIGDITADTIVDTFNSIGLDISGKIRTEVEADTGLPVRAYVDLALVSAEESESDQQKTALFIADDDDDDYDWDDDDDGWDDDDGDWDDDDGDWDDDDGGFGFDPSMLGMLGNIKISCVVNFPEKCSLLNNADLTLKVTIGDEENGTTLSAAVKWSAEDSADAFNSKLKIELPAILTDNSSITINFDYDKKTKEFHAYYGDEFDLKFKLEYTDSTMDVTLVSLTAGGDTIDLKNIRINIKNSKDFPEFPTNYTEVSADDIKDIFD